MPLETGNSILASDFISLKARIKAECARRKYNGSVASYASSQYDYTITPSAGDAPRPEHYNKIIIPFNAITGRNLSTKANDDIIPSLEDVSDTLETLEATDVRSSNTGCNASCTGLCKGTCTGNCSSGCTGTCTGGCGSNCSGGCTGSCQSSCAVACSSCSNSCGTACSSGCGNNCTSSCTGGCSKMCMGTCKGISEFNPVE